MVSSKIYYNQNSGAGCFIRDTKLNFFRELLFSTGNGLFLELKFNSNEFSLLCMYTGHQTMTKIYFWKNCALI